MAWFEFYLLDVIKQCQVKLAKPTYWHIGTIAKPAQCSPPPPCPSWRPSRQTAGHCDAVCSTSANRGSTTATLDWRTHITDITDVTDITDITDVTDTDVKYWKHHLCIFFRAVNFFWVLHAFFACFWTIFCAFWAIFARILYFCFFQTFVVLLLRPQHFHDIEPLYFHFDSVTKDSVTQWLRDLVT